ncbi:MAG: ABC transporter substrate-binding protein [Propionibacteriaceae bacterium]|nr:ABC transporter substrate-binding protein [Propionibacteriaceae bacterium]
MTLNRRCLLLGAAAATAAPLAACTGAKPAAGEAITVGLTFIPNVQFSPFYVAESEGLFKDAGLDLSIRHHGTQEGLFTALQSGDEHIVFASSDEAMVAAADGLPALRTFATCYQRYPGVILGSAGVTHLSDLAGHSVGVPGGYGSSWFTTLAALKQAGLTADDVAVQPIGWTQVAALTTGKVDAVVGFRNNEAVQLAAAGTPFTQLEVIDAAVPQLVGPGLVTLADTVPTSQLEAVVDAVLEAERRIAADPELALKATETQVPTLADQDQRAQAAKVLEATVEIWATPAGQISLDVNPADFTRMGEFLTAAGVIAQAPAESVLAVA